MTEVREPSVMNGVIPYLSLAGRTAEAMDFYTRAFGARDLGRMPFPDRPDALMHAQTEINGGALMLTDHRMGDTTEAPLAHGHLQLVVDDGAAWWGRAVAAGCEIVLPFERQDWGDDWGMLRDPFGVLWAILQDGGSA